MTAFKTKSGRPGRLNDRAQDFARLFVSEAGRNATLAYRMAGFQSKGAAAKANASRLLARPDVSAEVRRLQAAADQALAERVGITAESTLRLIAVNAHASIKRLFREDGSLVPVHEIPDDVAECIESITVNETFEGSGEDRRPVRVVKITFANKSAAQDRLAKHFNLYAKHERQKGEAAASSLAALLQAMKPSALPVVHVIENDA